jgi:hypothetical protein
LTRATALIAIFGGAEVGLEEPAQASGLTVTITCKTPTPDRQVSPSYCLNHKWDHTQTYTAHVKRNGNPVAGATVHFTDSDSVDAHFRIKTVTCTTNSRGVCSSELVDDNPFVGEIIHTHATSGGVKSAAGTLRFIS